MSAQIQWSIDWLQASTQTINGYSEVVLTCGWRCTGTEANTATPPVTFTNSVYGTCSFPEPAAGAAFTPAADLTTEQVIGWCWSNGVDKAATEAAIAANLNLQMNPTAIFLPPPAK
jgi:hypothetical protein